MSRVVRVLVYEGDPELIQRTMRKSILNGYQIKDMRIISATIEVENIPCFMCNVPTHSTTFICESCLKRLETFADNSIGENENV